MFILVPILVCGVLACIGVIFWSRKAKRHSQQSTVETETIPLREPANIGLSQEETSHGIEEQPDIPHTPVEETSPAIVMPAEKQDIFCLE